MILSGDLRQLPPVRASEIYKRCREMGGLFGSTITWHYLDYFPLVQVVAVAAVRMPTTGKLALFRSKQAVNEAKRNGYDVENTWISIEPRTVTLTIDRKTGIACKRGQFPLVQASAITVHKSQGGTYSYIVYEYSKIHPQKLVYVAQPLYKP